MTAATYVWGIFGFIGAFQIAEGNNAAAFICGSISFVALIVALSQTKE